MAQPPQGDEGHICEELPPVESCSQGWVKLPPRPSPCLLRIELCADCTSQPGGDCRVL